MTFKVTLTIICSILLLQIVDVKGDARRKSCGTELFKRISLVCDALGGFNTYYAVPHHRVKRRIVDECCRKPCSFYTIAKYCRYDAEDNYRKNRTTTAENSEIREPSYWIQAMGCSKTYKSAEMETKDELENLAYHKVNRRNAVYFPFKKFM